MLPRVNILFLLCVLLVLLLIYLLLNTSSQYSVPHPKISYRHLVHSIETDRLVDFVNSTRPYHLSPESPCNDETMDLLGVILVSSYVTHDNLRSAHRRAMPQDKLKSLGLLRFFLLAEIPAHEKLIAQESIEGEHRRFGDIVQGNFIDAYKNLTYKHIMGLKWASIECFRSSFIVKMDDDTVYDITRLRRMLQGFRFSHEYDDLFLSGYVQSNKKPIRMRPSKWFVSHKEFRDALYPTYLSGWLYITNQRTAFELVSATEDTPFFWIDDIYVTGILAKKISAPLERRNTLFSANHDFLECCIRDAENHKFKCPYLAGPNGGNPELIVRFTSAISGCRECRDRKDSDPKINETCVGVYKSHPGHRGAPEVKELNL
uniref:Hexosyltransferase n=1 Tax=Phlebotomus papatasi TaxID=29031 RepID=A0A1B0D975_PHLPP